MAAAAAAALVLGALPGRAQVEYHPPDQKYIGARGAALGDAIASDEYNIESMYRNPATLASLRRAEAVADQRHDYAEGVFGDDIAARVFASRAMALGIGLGATHAGKLTHGGAFRFTEYDLDAGYAYRFPAASTNFSIGVLGNLRTARDDSASRSAGQVSLGLLYSPAAGTSYSLVYRGLGTGLSYAADPAAPGPVTSARVDHFAKSLEVGSTMRYPASSTVPFITISIAGEKDLETRFLRLRGGAEYTLAGILSFRLGYVNAEVWQVRYGLGLSLPWLSVDYAVMPVASAGKFDEITLRIALQ